MKRNSLEITLGKDSNNKVYRNSLFDICHILIGSDIDKDKDNLITNLIKDLIYYNSADTYKIALCDLTRKDYSWIEKEYLYSYPISKDIDYSFMIINEIYHEVRRRINLLHKDNIKNINSYNTKYSLNIDSIVLIISEYSKIIKQEKENFESKISYILENGRICNIFVILATKDIKDEVITKKIESYFPSKICFSTTKQKSYIITESFQAAYLKEDEFVYYTSNKTDFAKLKLL